MIMPSKLEQRLNAFAKLLLILGLMVVTCPCEAGSLPPVDDRVSHCHEEMADLITPHGGGVSDCCDFAAVLKSGMVAKLSTDQHIKVDVLDVPPTVGSRFSLAVSEFPSYREWRRGYVRRLDPISFKDRLLT